MSLRPRYSLLTLLVLTALVAGGVKWWYGPHHVVEIEELPGEVIEKEFTFTRTWDGSRVLRGPHVRRTFYREDGSIANIRINYYRQGVQLRLWYHLFQYDVDNPTVEEPWTEDQIARAPLSREEFLELQQAMEREKRRELGPGLKWFAYLHPVP